MPSYRLESGQEVLVSARQLHLRAWDRRTMTAVQLRAEHRGGRAAETWSPNPERTILPTVREPTVLRVVPPAGQAAFGADVEVTVHLQADLPPHAEQEEVLLEAVPVAGRAAPEVMELDGESTLIRVRAVRAPVEGPARGLSARVGAEARRLLGTDEIAGHERARLVVGVDCSGSMRGPLQDGSVAALVEAVAGLARVVGDGDPAQVLLLGRQSRRLTVSAEAELGTTVQAELLKTGFEVGFRPAVDDLPCGPGRTVGYLVTDAEPSNAADLAVAHPVEWHVLVAGTAAAGHGPVISTALERPPAGTAATEFLQTPGGAAALSALVSSMLTHWKGAGR